MYINVAYLEGMMERYLTPVDLEDRSVPLRVLCCGFYRVTDADPVIDTPRPNGRKDYQLLYFHAGQGRFSFRAEEDGGQCTTLVTAGQVVLFRPHDRQVYEYYPSDHTEVYWVHFTGSQVEEMLEQFGFGGKEQIYWGGVTLEYQNLFRKMIKELQLCRKGYETMLTHQLQALLILLSRNRHNPYATGTQAEQMVNDAQLYFNENYAKALSINDYAASVYVSSCWLIRSFRQYVGVTPLQYIINVRMSNARELLLNPALSISDVASSVGYDDPFYFSRLFKKCVGVSPREYRHAYNEKQ
ncbi:MAG: AraC family transcriptional regulator [Clostridiales bacterium]|nr:AraC family transcriptional regulator [Clostridiales bacterium]